MKQKRCFLFILFLISTLWACNPLKKLTDNEYLVNRNIIKTDKIAVSEELTPIIKQKPNRKILGIARFHLIVYNLANKGKERKYKTWIKNTIGEEPVILDSSLTEKTTKQMKLFLQNKGYFDAQVHDSIVLKKNKVVNVYYIINEGKPYTINNVFYDSKDSAINAILIADKPNSLIKTGNNYDTDVLQAERERITAELRNRGYFKFVKEYLHCTADSAIGNRKVDLFVTCDRINENDSVPVNHQVYTINEIFVQTDYNPLNPYIAPSDTVNFKGYHFLRNTKKRIFKHNIILQSVFVKPQETYALHNVDATYKRLGGLTVFRFINVKFTDVPAKPNSINAFISLTPLPRKSFSVETEGTHNGGNLGVGATFNVRNKNIFGGAELFEFKIKGGLEAQRTFTTDETNNKKTLYLFNTVEIGPELNLVFPRFLLPFKVRGFSKNSIPSTSITTAYNYQLNPLYRRYITNLSLNYRWNESAYKRHIVTLFEINGVKIDHDDSLVNRLKQVNDILLLNSYRSHLITASRYTFIYNNQDVEKKRRIVNFFTGSIEFAGNILRSFNSVRNSLQNETGSYLIAGLPYAQYIKTDLDYRIYHNINDKNSLAYRLNAGIGVAYGNSQVLPFEKSFFAGGSNDIRAWEIRRLGPGSYANKVNVDQIGDIKLEANFEYRFEILRLIQGPIFQGATFIDAGNIFTLKNDPVRQGSQLKANRLFDDLAIGSGIGLRINFTFFIIRLDMGVKLHDPALTGDDRWVGTHLFSKSWKDNYTATNGAKYPFTNFNFGIGYPF